MFLDRPPNVGAKAKGAGSLGAFYEMLGSVTKRKGCMLVDSLPSTDSANVEKIYYVHYSGKAGRAWGSAAGRRVVELIREIAALKASPTPDRALSGFEN